MVICPAVLLALLGVMTLIGRPLSERATAHATEAAVLAGLSASVWTRDLRLGLTLANQLKVGTVWLNEHLMIFCETPWGGCKESGYGKDLSTMVLEEYVHTKHIYMDVTGAPVKPWYMILK